MKIRNLLIAILLVFVFTSCGQRNRKKQVVSETTDQAVNIADQDNMPSAEGTFTSELRPGEGLLLGKKYTDTLEYVGYNGEGDYPSLEMMKGDMRHTFIDDSNVDLTAFNRGDLLEIQWLLDSLRYDGDGLETLWFEEFVMKAIKIKDGNVSMFKKKHPRPMAYRCNEEDEFSEYFLDVIYRNVEYYLANSRQEAVKAALAEPDAMLSYSVEKRETDGRPYFAIGIRKGFGDDSDCFQWIYLNNEEYPVRIYEYDPADDTLTLFE